MFKLSHTRLRGAARPLAALLILSATAACSTTVSKPTPSDETDVVSYRQERFSEVSRMQAFASCRDEGFEMDRMARQSGNSGQYLISARVLEDCLFEASGQLDRDEEMQIMALTIQNYAKGGDAATAHDRLRLYKETFQNHDLYYADGTSFSETMEMALGVMPIEAAGAYSTANVNDKLKSEVRRAHYWQRN